MKNSTLYLKVFAEIIIKMVEECRLRLDLNDLVDVNRGNPRFRF